ncbi:peptide deformylase [Nonomuraea sp. NPDC050783]|uniref:peptide deformylase n=1 Tax=Nonomuraea sp. NPDC050783 TaxID=3154634 RepID=UPI00346505D9
MNHEHAPGARPAASGAKLVEQVHALLAAPRPWPVVQVGDPVLRGIAAPYDGQLPDALLRDLLDAMFRHLPGVGVGIAAPQLGIPLALAVIEDPADVPPEIAAERQRAPQPPLELVNPVLTPLGSRYHAFHEACLSVEGFTAVVARHAQVRLSALDGGGRPYELELSGWPARIAQHETDHLGGVLYLDRAEPRSLSTIANHERFWTPRPRPAP